MGFLSLFPFFRPRPERWTYSPGETVWRLLPSSSGFLAGESRSEEKKSVAFFCLDIVTGETRWQGLQFKEPWWVGIESIANGVLLVHEFARPDLPGHSGLHAIDIASGTVLWSRQDLTYRSVEGNNLIASTASTPGALMSVNLRSGDVLQTFEEEPMISDRTPRERVDPTGGGYRMPEPLTEGDVLYALIRKMTSSEIVEGRVETLTIEESSIFSYYTREKGKDSRDLAHRITVTDRAGRRIYSTLAHSHARMPVMDTFFVFNKTLCFVREERTVVGVDLP